MGLKGGVDLITDKPRHLQRILRLLDRDLGAVSRVTCFHAVRCKRRRRTKRFRETGILLLRQVEELLEIVRFGKLDLPPRQVGLEELFGGLLAMEGNGPGVLADRREQAFGYGEVRRRPSPASDAPVRAGLRQAAS